ncbi:MULTISPECIES: aldehyde dehydrogenase family protein [unclassified Burkholderia]|uniref:aldehyde dehydrogenase family protein n=1 Tax=unclassified Burkholderia TaxID=2613784 RepID=UPI000F570898|nr:MULTISPECIES: aldehyde dehydrogenase family protein [unclassified Burkholderia]RQR71119.1 aldehyde dehydrogenase family protein [Burkholderia sp. Bp9011]RQR83740.1 aldehyde dehydrogenase family protein [Burkholderia sp. Bp9010]RQS64897.1 aldehyde dehydrogenase family protein [Burkholderia sp. Bp8977]
MSTTPDLAFDPPLHTRHFIDGTWRTSFGGATLPVVDPSTEMVIADVSAGDDADVEHAVQAASRAFRDWKRTTGATRAALLRAIARGVDARRTRLATLQSLNNGKPFAEAEIDVADVIATFDYYAGLAEALDTDGETEIALPGGDHRAWIRREPAGVAALIVPWNFPMVTTAWKLAPALAAGCTVVLKPSEITPLPELELAAIVAEAGLPPGVLNVVTGTGHEVGARLCAHPLVAKVSFTGSTAVGAQVMKTAADTIKGVGLELGGKSSIVVFDDADLDHAVDLVAGGGLFNAGQMCSATSRVLVAAPLADDLIARLARRIETTVVGPPFAPGVQMGPLTNRAQYERVKRHIAQGRADGARLVTGGDALAGPGYFIRPALFADVPPGCALWRDEIFGPVLCVRAFDAEDDAIAAANDTEYGLVATVVTRDAARGRRVANALEAGVVWINTPQLIYPQTSWGGYKRSSVGRELGPFGLAAFQEIKQVMTAAR